MKVNDKKGNTGPEQVSNKISEDTRNAKERLYDRIPISLKALDIVIGVLITALVIIMLYFILRRFSY